MVKKAFSSPIYFLRKYYYLPCLNSNYANFAYFLNVSPKILNQSIKFFFFFFRLSADEYLVRMFLFFSKLVSVEL